MESILNGPHEETIDDVDALRWDSQGVIAARKQDHDDATKEQTEKPYGPGLRQAPELHTPTEGEGLPAPTTRCDTSGVQGQAVQGQAHLV